MKKFLGNLATSFSKGVSKKPTNINSRQSKNWLSSYADELVETEKDREDYNTKHGYEFWRDRIKEAQSQVPGETKKAQPGVVSDSGIGGDIDREMDKDLGRLGISTDDIKKMSRGEKISFLRGKKNF